MKITMSRFKYVFQHIFVLIYVIAAGVGFGVVILRALGLLELTLK